MSAIKTVLATKTLGLLVLNFKDPGGKRVLSFGESQAGIQCLTQRDATENTTGTQLHLPECGH